MTELEIQELQAKLATLQTEKDNLAAANAEAVAKVSALTAVNASKDAEIASAKQQVENLVADKEAATSDFYAMQKKANELAAKLKQEQEKDAPLSFEISEDDEDLDIKEGDVFEFTAPTCTWDDNTVINFRELADAAKVEAEEADKARQEGKDWTTKDRQRYAVICAELVQRKSGLIRKKGE